ncbi:MAG: DNA repair protein RecO [Nitrospirota bacterium]
MLKRTEGIVLKTTPFGEADLIVTYLTLDFGLLKAFAKGPRKIKSRFGSSLEPFTHSRISFWGKEDTTLPRLTQSDIIYSFQTIRDTLSCFLKVSEIAELTMHFIPERDVNKKVFSLLLNTLHDIENNPPEFPHTPFCKVIPPHPLLLKGGRGDFKGGKWGLSGADLMINHYKIKFLEYVGFAPKLDACGRCGKVGIDSYRDGYCFYVSHGSVLCEDCAKGMDSPRTTGSHAPTLMIGVEHACEGVVRGSPARLSPGVVKLYADLLIWDITKIKRIRPSVMLLSGLSDIMDMHIKYILTRPLKSKSFI